MSADRLRPEAERAARFAAAARIERNVRVLEIAAEVFVDVEVALVDRRHERQQVHVVKDLAIVVANDDAFLVAIGDAFHVRPVAAVGDFLDREIELVARDEINGRGFRERLLGFDRDLGADEADFRGRVHILDHLGRFDVLTERRRRGVQDDQIFAANVAFDVLEGEIMRRRVDQLRAFNERRWLREPCRIPERAHLALHLIARAGTAIVAVKRGSLQKERAHIGTFQRGVTEPSVSTL